MQTSASVLTGPRRATGKEFQVVTFRAWGRDLALPMDCLRGIHRWHEQQKIPIATRPAELEAPAAAEAFARTLHVATASGLKAVPVGAIAEITPVWVEKRQGTPAWAFGTARISAREVLVLDPTRL